MGGENWISERPLTASMDTGAIVMAQHFLGTILDDRSGRIQGHLRLDNGHSNKSYCSENYAPSSHVLKWRKKNTHTKDTKVWEIPFECETVRAAPFAIRMCDGDVIDWLWTDSDSFERRSPLTSSSRRRDNYLHIYI